jgi:hypothetical protein
MEAKLIPSFYMSLQISVMRPANHDHQISLDLIILIFGEEKYSETPN